MIVMTKLLMFILGILMELPGVFSQGENRQTRQYQPAAEQAQDHLGSRARNGGEQMGVAWNRWAHTEHGGHKPGTQQF
jgi:hypothetical protein